MSEEIVFIVLGMALSGLAIYLLMAMGLGLEYTMPMIVGIGGGMMIGIGIIWRRSKKLEEIIRGLQEMARPRGSRLVMPWDEDVLRLMIARSYPKIVSLIRERVEGVRE